MYTVDYFIKKFQAIPEEFWIAGKMIDFVDTRRRCAQGHCFSDSDLKGRFDKGSECYSLVELFDPGYHERPSGQKGSIKVARINNGWDERYKQDTPKQRVLAALYDIKKLESPEYKDITASIAGELKESPECVDKQLVISKI